MILFWKPKGGACIDRMNGAIRGVSSVHDPWVLGSGAACWSMMNFWLVVSNIWIIFINFPY